MAFKKSLILAALLLAGCDDTLTLNQVCTETPGFCEDLNKDSHCKDERAELIYARYHEYKSPTEDNKYTLLKHLEDYNQCVSLGQNWAHQAQRKNHIPCRRPPYRTKGNDTGLSRNQEQ